MTPRRPLLVSVLAAPFVTRHAARSATPGPVPDSGPDPAAALERAGGGRIGVFADDPAARPLLAWRADEPFPMQSTFKAPLAAFVLARVQTGHDRLDQELPYGRADLMPVSPVTQAHLAAGRLAIGTLVAAILERSDNTAANLLLAHVGGPAALTAFIRRLGDDVTTIRRPELLDAPAAGGNTTSPRAFAGLMRAILLGPVLDPAGRRRLRAHMSANQAGRNRLRAVLPPGWSSADRTGTGEGVCNDAVLAWPPGRAPLAIAVFTDQPAASLAGGEAELRAAGRLVLARLG